MTKPKPIKPEKIIQEGLKLLKSQLSYYGCLTHAQLADPASIRAVALIVKTAHDLSKEDYKSTKNAAERIESLTNEQSKEAYETIQETQEDDTADDDPLPPPPPDPETL